MHPAAHRGTHRDGNTVRSQTGTAGPLTPVTTHTSPATSAEAVARVPLSQTGSALPISPTPPHRISTSSTPWAITPAGCVTGDRKRCARGDFVAPLRYGWIGRVHERIYRCCCQRVWTVADLRRLGAIRPRLLPARATLPGATDRARRRRDGPDRAVCEQVVQQISPVRLAGVACIVMRKAEPSEQISRSTR